MKGILLAGGTGSRLFPLTLATNKHLLPVYQQPMYYYSLNNMINAGINKVFIVTSGDYFEQFENQLKSDKKIKEMIDKKELEIDFGLQYKPRGIADALGQAERFAENDSVAVMLADNIYGDDDFLKETAKKFKEGGHIFLKEIPNEQLFEFNEKYNEKRAKYGIAEIKNGKIESIEEKPAKPKTNLVVTGAYIYDNTVFDIIRKLKPSGRGELEISDVNNAYIQTGKIQYSILNGWWCDAGENKDALFFASITQFAKEKKIENIEKIINDLTKKCK